jgi:hydrogenase nickel incorporation protein HypA/HybF
MHEGTIARSILNTALSAAEGKPVKKVLFRAGALSGIEKEPLLLFFNELKKETPAAGAQLEILTLPASLTCVSCSRQANYDGTIPLAVTCAVCGGDNRLAGGKEMFVESIEVAK